MIEQTGGLDQAAQNEQGVTRKVLKMVKNSRMGGSVPMWETVTTPIQKTEEQLSLAQSGGAPESFKATLAYQAQDDMTGGEEEIKEFGFGDLVDMINPLHHIPVVGHLYRELSGDSIQPIGQIIGGAVFGGAVGAASGLVNVIVSEETGKDIAGNAMSFVVDGEKPRFKSSADHPETRLNEAVSAANGNDLPASLLAFTDQGHSSGIVIEKINAAQGRTAGSFDVRTTYPKEEAYNLPPREPITQVNLSPYGKY